MIILLLIIIFILVIQNFNYRGLISRDVLCPILNKRRFEADLSNIKLRRYQDKAILILIDLNRFKLVNDIYGHKAGDTVLLEFSKFLSAKIRKSDGVYRIGGDEFAIITDNIDIIVKIKQNPIIAVSVGWANIKESENAFEEADKMLYKNKRSGE